MKHARLLSIPNTLFKYVDAKGGLATLEGKEISVMFSKPSDLNDPFEFLPSLKQFFSDDTTKRLDQACQEIGLTPFVQLMPPGLLVSECANSWKEDIESHWFVTSFTKTDRNVRMWDQYGGSHTGIKLTFNLTSSDLKTQKENMRKVRYLNAKRIDISRLGKEPPLREEQKVNLLQQIATRKGRDWEHEEEVRWFLRDDDRDRPDKRPFEKKVVDGKMRAFMKLPHDCIKRVTVGYRSPPSLLRTVLEIRKMNEATWEVARTVLSLNSFRFEEELVSCSEA